MEEFKVWCVPPCRTSVRVQLLPGLCLTADQRSRGQEGSGHGLGSAKPLFVDFASSQASLGTFLSFIPRI